MSSPEIKMMAISNVFSRVMHFKNAGDVEAGHRHFFDHGTLVSSGSAQFEILDGYGGNVVSSKVISAPNFAFIAKETYHRITALEDNTVCVCIHALREADETILDPAFFIEQVDGDGKGSIPKAVIEKTDGSWHPIVM